MDRGAWQATAHGVRHARATVTLQWFLILSWQNAPILNSLQNPSSALGEGAPGCSQWPAASPQAASAQLSPPSSFLATCCYNV